MEKRIKKKGLIVFILIVLSMVGCAINNSVVPIHYADPSMTLSKLLKDNSSFILYYSGPRYNPSAILFLKKAPRIKIVLSKKWKKIQNLAELRDILERITYLNPSLQGIILPSSRRIVGYLYTPGTTYLLHRGKNRYFLLGVDEIFNDIYYDEQWPFWKYQIN